MRGAAGVGIFLATLILVEATGAFLDCPFEEPGFMMGTGPSNRVFFPAGLLALEAEAREEVVFFEIIDFEVDGLGAEAGDGAEVALRFVISFTRFWSVSG